MRFEILEENSKAGLIGNLPQTERRARNTCKEISVVFGPPEN